MDYSDEDVANALNAAYQSMLGMQNWGYNQQANLYNAGAYLQAQGGYMSPSRCGFCGRTDEAIDHPTCRQVWAMDFGFRL